MTFWKRQDCKDSKKLVVAKGLREGERNEYVEHGILSAWKLFCVIPQWWPHDSMHLSKLIELYNTKSDQFSSVQSLSHVQLFVTALTAACQASLSITNSQGLLKLMFIELAMSSSHLILCCPLLLPPSIFLSIRAFSNEPVLHIRWPKYCSFSFNICPSNEYSGLISLRIDWLDLLGVQGALNSLFQHHSSKASILRHSAFFIVQFSHPYMTTGKTIALPRLTFVSKVTSLLFNMLSRLVRPFLPRSKCLLISWLQSPSAVILEPPKNKVCHCFHCLPIYLP